ncbi:MAG TPA: hypothetical protein VG944_20785 [Fimbriimonas sp.]|nr:hypothetical protein [Fimbriimonas sp.]
MNSSAKLPVVEIGTLIPRIVGVFLLVGWCTAVGARVYWRIQRNRNRRP